MSAASPESVRLQIIKDTIGNSDTDLFGVSAMDDAAFVPIPGSELGLVVASDFVRGTEFYLFDLGFINHYDVGYYLIAANLSDMAAMGVKPAGVTTVIRYTKSQSDEEFLEIFRGMKAACEAHATEIVGGDTGGYVSDVFVATAFGFATRHKLLTRSGAKPGDIVCLSGPVGGGIACLTYFKELRAKSPFLSKNEEERLLQSWKRPLPHIALGSILSEHALASSCIDVSDGLKASLDQVSKASAVGFEISEAEIPMSNEVRAVANAARVDAVGFASSASVDFQLLFTIPPQKIDRAREVLATHNISMNEVGVTTQSGEVTIKRATGNVEQFPGKAWDHQPGDHVKELLKNKMPSRK